MHWFSCNRGKEGRNERMKERRKLSSLEDGRETTSYVFAFGSWREREREREGSRTQTSPSLSLSLSLPPCLFTASLCHVEMESFHFSRCLWPNHHPSLEEEAEEERKPPPPSWCDLVRIVKMTHNPKSKTQCRPLIHTVTFLSIFPSLNKTVTLHINDLLSNK